MSDTILSMMQSFGPVSSLLEPEILSTMTMSSASDIELNGMLDEIGFFDKDNTEGGEEDLFFPSPCGTPSPPMSLSVDLRLSHPGGDVETSTSSTNCHVDDDYSFVPVSPDRSSESPEPHVAISTESYDSWSATANNTFIAPKPSMVPSVSVVSVSSSVAAENQSTASLMTVPLMMNYGYNNHPSSSPMGSSMKPIFNPSLNLPSQPVPSLPATAALAAALAVASSSSSSSSTTTTTASSNNVGSSSSSFPPMVWPSTLASMQVHQQQTNQQQQYGRKRKERPSTSSGTSAEKTLSSNGDEKSMTEEEDRRERNRLHAKKSRLRKKSLTGSLHDTLAVLKEENMKLRELIYAKIGEKETNDMLQRRIVDSHNRFISSFSGTPDKRVMDPKTLSLLRGLRKNVQKVTKKRIGPE